MVRHKENIFIELYSFQPVSFFNYLKISFNTFIHQVILRHLCVNTPYFMCIDLHCTYYKFDDVKCRQSQQYYCQTSVFSQLYILFIYLKVSKRYKPFLISYSHRMQNENFHTNVKTSLALNQCVCKSLKQQLLQ